MKEPKNFVTGVIVPILVALIGCVGVVAAAWITGLLPPIIGLIQSPFKPVAHLSPPPGFVILDQFDNRDPLTSYWELAEKDNPNIGTCSAAKRNGYLRMKCPNSKNCSYWLEYTPINFNMKQLAGGTSSGIAMSAKLVKPDSGTKVKVHFVVMFTSPDGIEKYRAYIVDMRSTDLRIAEAYPLKGWSSRDLISIPIDSEVFHVLQVEYKSDHLTFLVDGEPVTLLVQPDLQRGSTWYNWAFGVGVDNSENEPVNAETWIDWIAVSGE